MKKVCLEDRLQAMLQKEISVKPRDMNIKRPTNVVCPRWISFIAHYSYDIDLTIRRGLTPILYA